MRRMNSYTRRKNLLLQKRIQAIVSRKSLSDSEKEQLIEIVLKKHVNDFIESRILCYIDKIKNRPSSTGRFE